MECREGHIFKFSYYTLYARKNKECTECNTISYYTFEDINIIIKLWLSTYIDRIYQ